MGADDCLRDLKEEQQMELAVPFHGARPLTLGEQFAADQRARDRRERDLVRLRAELTGGVE